MGAIHDEKTYGLTIRESATDGSDFTNPDADYRRLFLGEDGELHAKDSAGAVTDLTGSGAQDLAGKELDYAEITSSASITATTEAGADTVVTGASVAYDGATIVFIEFAAPWWNPDTVAAGRQIALYLFEDGASLGRIGLHFSQVAGVNAHMPLRAATRLTPTNASHTYSIRSAVSTGSGTIAAGAGGSGAERPAFLRITRVSS